MQKIPNKTSYFLLLCFFCFIISGTCALMLPTSIPKNKTAEIKQQKVPFATEKPDDVCFMLTLFDAEWEIILDFENSQTLAVNKNNEIFSLQEKYIDISDQTLCGIIDRIGGIDFTVTEYVDGYDNLPRHYSGGQIINLFTELSPDSPLKNELLCAVIEKIGSLGFSNDDFCYIINNSSTNISYIDYYGVSSHIADCFGVCRFFD